jgi:peptidyl-prolyl cis-trans isomerase A (cyclophilin A)/peptidyl-prolyl cis-trans isomerase B (cyclophilin B)
MMNFISRVSIACALLLSFTLGIAHAADNPRVLMQTSKGDIVLELYPDKAPKSVANFVQYVKDGHYNGTVFHRVINNFMVQGGGFDKNLHQKPTRAAIENEAKNGLKNEAYTLAMARTSDPHSATAQFFINVKHNRFLDYPGQDGWGYAVFGKVIKGQEVVDKIKQTPTGRMDIPQEQIVIESAKLLP